MKILIILHLCDETYDETQAMMQNVRPGICEQSAPDQYSRKEQMKGNKRKK